MTSTRRTSEDITVTAPPLPAPVDQTDPRAALADVTGQWTHMHTRCHEATTLVRGQLRTLAGIVEDPVSSPDTLRRVAAQLRLLTDGGQLAAECARCAHRVTPGCPDCTRVPERWRVGRRNGHTVYRQRGPEPRRMEHEDHDDSLGYFRFQADAARAVAAVNALGGDSTSSAALAYGPGENEPCGFPARIIPTYGPDSPENGHSFDVAVSSRGSYGGPDGVHHDAGYWDGHMRLRVRGWSLPAALHVAASAPLADWRNDDDTRLGDEEPERGDWAPGTGRHDPMTESPKEQR